MYSTVVLQHTCLYFFFVSVIIHKQLRMPFHSLPFSFLLPSLRCMNENKIYMVMIGSSGFDTAPDHFILLRHLLFPFLCLITWLPIAYSV